MNKPENSIIKKLIDNLAAIKSSFKNFTYAVDKKPVIAVEILLSSLERIEQRLSYLLDQNVDVYKAIEEVSSEIQAILSEVTIFLNRPNIDTTAPSNKKSIASIRTAINYIEELFKRSGLDFSLTQEYAYFKLIEESESKLQIVNSQYEILQNKIDEQVKKSNELENKLEVITNAYQDRLKQIDQLYTNTSKSLEQKEQQADRAISHIAEKVMAGDFAESAGSERKQANLLRNSSIICMLVMISIVGYSFYESTQNTIEWTALLVRLSLIFLLSIPAAYLAKESTKHRNQEFSHLQTSLDLKALTPFLASLPEDKQHQLKIDIANKIFAKKSEDSLHTNTYPINIHEVLIELIKGIQKEKN